jgi:hypothetical protein
MIPARFTFAALLVLLLALPLSAAVCVNKYLSRADGAKQIVTLLTGKLTFQEAQALAKSINERTAPPLEWVDANGKTIAKQFGELKVVRPMPVGCDGKTSGVVMIAIFQTLSQPSGKITVKLDANTPVFFDQQKD